MIDLLNWTSTNPKLTIGILVILWCIIGEVLDHKYGERF